MYAVEVRDSVMIAHSLPGEVFGPAQRLHGATYVVDVAFFAEALDDSNIVVDIGLATEILGEVLKSVNYRNLDELPQFEGIVTTTEFLARHIFDLIATAARGGRLGASGEKLSLIRVRLHESHVARAWYEGAP